MPKHRPWTRRQREQLQFLAGYAAYLREKVAGYAATGRAVPLPLSRAVGLLPRLKQKIENDDFVSGAELWRELDALIVDWHVEESRQWKPKHGHRPGFRPN